MNTRTLFALLFATPLFFPLSAVYGATISGTVSLPDGDIVPAGGLSVTVKAVDLDGVSIGPTHTVTIPEEGEPSTTYSLTVQTDPNARWRIHYFSDATNAYHDFGYYSSGGTQWIKDLATTIYPAEDRPNINMELLRANTINGTISLPLGADNPPDGGLPVQISATLATDIGITGGSTSVLITSNSVPTAFELFVPSDPAAQWHIKYDYDADLSYFPHGFYSEAGTTSWNQNKEEVTELSGGVNHPISGNPEISLELLNNYTISGTVSLPAPFDTPAEGLRVQITYEDIDRPTEWFGYTFVTLNSPENLETYTLSLPGEPAAHWRVHYFLPDSDTFVQRGYYSDGGTQWDPLSATPFIDANFSPDPALTGKNIVLLAGDQDGYQEIRGTVSRPQTGTEPQGGMDVKIEVKYLDGLWGYSRWITIPEGAPTASFTVPIPADDGDPLNPTRWRVSYFYRGAYNYLISGYYYSPTVTHWDYNQATTLVGNTDLTNIPLTLIYAPGDVNGSGLADLTDVILSLQVITGQTPAEEIKRGADANADTRIGIEEAIHSLRTAAGIN